MEENQIKLRIHRIRELFQTKMKSLKLEIVRWKDSYYLIKPEEYRPKFDIYRWRRFAEPNDVKRPGVENNG